MNSIAHDRVPTGSLPCRVIFGRGENAHPVRQIAILQLDEGTGRRVLCTRDVRNDAVRVGPQLLINFIVTEVVAEETPR